MSKKLVLTVIILAVIGAPGLLSSANPQRWRAGSAEVVITPHESLWLAGFAARTRPAEGTSLDLYAKALVLEDQAGNRAALVTTDLENLPVTLGNRSAARVEKQFGIPRRSLLLNISHTHCSPVLDHMEEITYDMTPEQWAAVDRYAGELEDKIVAVIGRAVHNLGPARLSFGITSAGFAANRREKPNSGVTQEGPVDHDVPFLKVEGRRGELRAVAFGYACHNTTLTNDFYQYSGDYAGYAQEWLEKHHPGTTALFVEGCGGDSNPSPRGTVELARKYGQELAEAVDGAARGKLRKVGGPLRSAYQEFPVAFAPAPTRAEFEAQLNDPAKYRRRHAEQMIKFLDRDGRLPGDYPYPLEVWQFGSDLTLVALSGECVVDYSLRLKKELGRQQLWVAGYSNDTAFAYIPSLRVLREGGYEGGEAGIYTGLPAAFAPSIEETIIRKVHELVDQVRGAQPQRQ
jgi:hypothetical protein